MHPPHRVEARSVLVTGADRGIGQGIALVLAAAGYRVGVNYHQSSELADQTAHEIARLGAEACTVRGDVRSARDVEAMIATVVRRFGGLHALINNAGVQTWTPLLDVSEDEWDLVIDTNLKGTFLCTQAAARHMKDHGGGSIVNIGSGSNKVGFAKLVAYTASKGGIETFTKVAAMELGPHAIRVNCVAPGAIEVDRTRLETPDYAAVWGGITPLRRIGTPADVGKAVAFLVGDESAFITGQTLWVDGGLFSQSAWPHHSGNAGS